MKSRRKEHIGGRNERLFFGGGEERHLEGSQATAARPSDRNNVEVKTLG
jgi:hypothetical protein